MSTDNPTWSLLELQEKLDEYEELLVSIGMSRNTINTYTQHPERFIRFLIGEYTPEGPRGDSETHALSKSQLNIRSKYAPLTEYLNQLTEPLIDLSFHEIEKILGFDLPASAFQYQAWWANEREGTHSHARSWLNASFKTANVDLNTKTVTFYQWQ